MSEAGNGEKTCGLTDCEPRVVVPPLTGDTGDLMGTQPANPAQGLTARVKERIDTEISSY